MRLAVIEPPSLLTLDALSDTFISSLSERLFSLMKDASVNVLLIDVDTLRADHLGCYGYRRMTSPHIDRLAAEGTVFLDMVAPHIPTHPSHTSMFTGHDMISHGVVAHGGKVEPDPEIKMLAEILAAQGYFTAAADNMGRWFERGFQEYRRYSWESNNTAPQRKAEAVTPVALDLLSKAAAQDRPFFLFVHYWDPHTPYLPPPPFTRMFYEGSEKNPENHSMDEVFAFAPFAKYFNAWLPGVTDRQYPIAEYDAEIAYADAGVAHVLTRLRELGLDGETLVIFTSDHGETMDEHGCFFDHHGLYDANLCIPLIVRCPGTVPAGQRLRGQVATYDIAPTILDYLGKGDLIAEHRMFGRSCKPLIEHGSHKGNYETLYVTECTWMRKHGIRTRDWKYIEALEPDFHNLPPVELYSLHEKPVKEVTNMVEARPDVVADLKGILADCTQRRPAQLGKPNPIMEQGISLRSVG